MKLNNYKQFLKENNQFNYDSVDDFLAEPGTHWGLILNYSSNDVSGVKYVGKFEGENYEQIMGSRVRVPNGPPNNQNWLSGLRKDFAESIKNCAMGMSYRDLCKTKKDPDNDFEQIQKEIEDDCGWNMQSIQNLFSPEIDALTFQQFQDFIKSYDLDANNGMTDIYLYKLAEKLGQNSEMVELGGSGWCEYATEEDEILIRYSYGQHHTKYGELMLKQIGISKENFIEQSLEKLRRQIIEDLEELQQIDIDDFFIVDFDRLVINLDDLLDQIHNYGIEADVRDFRDMQRSDLLSEIKVILSNHRVKMEIIDTGRSIILYDKKN